MNKTVSESVAYAKEIATWAQTAEVEASVAILPPFTALAHVAQELGKVTTRVPVQLGGQNMHWEDAGAFTGEISPLLLRDAGADLVEVGHYERRVAFGETDTTVNRKVLSALRHGLSVVLCIGEPEAMRDFEVGNEYVSIQLKIALHRVPAAALANVVIAYEPGWAIGAHGKSATARHVANVHRHLRAILIHRYGEGVGGGVRIVYGGSVTRETVASFAADADIDGLFVGRAAWEVSQFVHIIETFCEKRA